MSLDSLIALQGEEEEVNTREVNDAKNIGPRRIDLETYCEGYDEDSFDVGFQDFVVESAVAVNTTTSEEEKKKKTPYLDNEFGMMRPYEEIEEELSLKSLSSGETMIAAGKKINK